jgi:hypothetical protein
MLLISEEIKSDFIQKLVIPRSIISKKGENGIIMTSPQKMIGIICRYISSIQPFHYPHLYCL